MSNSKINVELPHHLNSKLERMSVSRGTSKTRIIATLIHLFNEEELYSIELVSTNKKSRSDSEELTKPKLINHVDLSRYRE